MNQLARQWLDWPEGGGEWPEGGGDWPDNRSIDSDSVRGMPATRREETECPICLNAFGRNTLHTECFHRYCRPCLLAALCAFDDRSRPGDLDPVYPCPVCAEPIRQEWVRTKGFVADIVDHRNARVAMALLASRGAMWYGHRRRPTRTSSRGRPRPPAVGASETQCCNIL